jgi:HEAT repeat protein/MFS family permease
VIKAVRSALFISEFGALKLPYVMIGIAVLAGVVTAFYIRLARRVTLRRLVVGSLVFFALNVVLLWWFAQQGYRWMFPVLYLWAGVFGVLATTQVWTLANDLFTTREAKRLFGVIGSGGILGAVVGGALARVLSPVIGSVNLLLVVAAMLVFAALVVALLTHVAPPSGEGRRAREISSPTSLTESLKVIRSSRHLVLLAGLVFLTALATTSVDFQFSLVAERAFADRDQLAAFFGTVYGSISLFAFLFQLLLTSRILSRFGIGFSLLLLPGALTLGTAALLATQSLWSAVLLKGSDGAFKHSLDRSCRELLYLPLPAAVKVQSKSTIDTVMDRLGDGSAGIVQWLLTTVLALGLRASLVANLVVIAIWAMIAIKLRLEYVNQLREALGKPSRLLSAAASPATDADTQRILDQVLSSGTEAERLGALEWIGSHEIEVPEDRLLSLAQDDPSSAVRSAALAVLLVGRDSVDLPREITDALDRDQGQVMVQAIDLLTENDVQVRQRRAEALIEGADPTTRLAVVALMLRKLGGEFEPFARRVFDALLAPDAPDRIRHAAVRGIVLLPPRFAPRESLGSLLADADPKVASAAAEAAARLDRLELLPAIIAMLGDPHTRAGARRALQRYGKRAVAPLAATLGDLERSPTVRRQVPTVLGRIGGEGAVTALAGCLRQPDPLLRDRAVVALYRLRREKSELRPLGSDGCMREIRRRSQNYRTLLQAERGIEEAGFSESDAARWLIEVLRQERHEALERIFMVLALEYPLAEMHQASRAVLTGSRVRHANAVELLDTTMPGNVKREIVPLLEILPTAGKEVAPSGPPWSAERALRTLVGWHKPWIAACALHAARKAGVRGLEADARALLDTDEPLLREEVVAYVGELDA